MPEQTKPRLFSNCAYCGRELFQYAPLEIMQLHAEGKCRK